MQPIGGSANVNVNAERVVSTTGSISTSKQGKSFISSVKGTSQSPATTPGHKRSAPVDVRTTTTGRCVDEISGIHSIQ